MKKYNIAVLGATGAVGQEMLNILAEYDIPVGELRPLASARSAGGTVEFKGEHVVIREANDEAFEGLDFVLGAVERISQNSSRPPSSKAARCSSTTAPPSAWIPTCRW